MTSKKPCETPGNTWLRWMLWLAALVFSQMMTHAQGVNLVANPSATSIPAGQNVSVSIAVQFSGGAVMDGVELYLSFNPASLQVLSLTPQNGILPVTLIPANFNNTSGQVNYAAGILGGNTGTNFTLLTVQFKALQTTTLPTLVTYNTTGNRVTEVAFAGNSILLGTASAAITIIPNPDDTDGDGVPNANDLCANTAPATAVNADGCSCAQLPPLTATLSGSSTICNGETALLQVNISGGTPQYSVGLSNGVNYVFANSGNNTIAVAPSASTNYNIVSLSDGLGCNASFGGSAAVTVNAPPTLTSSDIDNNICNGEAVTFTVTPTGATNYEFFVDNVSVQSSTLNTFTTSALVNGSKVYAVVTGVGNCASNVTTTTFADFNAGTFNNTATWQIGDGALTLAPAEGSIFNILPSGWISIPWTGGAASVNSGQLQVDGTLYATNASYAPGRTLEALATFGAATFQHLGFGQTLQTESGESWAMFSTFNTTNQLYARTNNNGTVSNVAIGAPNTYVGSAHVYQIEWEATEVRFYIDDALVHTAAVAIGANMRPALSDFTSGDPVLSVDWLRMTPFSTPGTFTSTVFDAGLPVNWGIANWQNTLPGGTSLTLEVRTGDTPTPDGSWTAFNTIANAADIPGASRYLQYRAILQTSNTRLTPVLESITIGYQPVAANTSVTNALMFLVNAAPTLTSSDPDNTICAGQSVTFTAQPVGAANYNFFLNGNSVQNGTSNLYTTTTLNNGDAIYVTATSLCGNSPTLVTTVGTTITGATLQAPLTPPCAGTPITLSLNVTGGTAPYSVVINSTPYNNVTNTATISPASSIWGNAIVPPVSNDGGAVEVGVKFQSAVSGYVTGIRFYKGAANTGTHTGRLWSANGTLLATVTFVNETPTGWQEAIFATPVLLAANTTYIVSYHAPNGNYGFSGGYFTNNSFTNGALTALASNANSGPTGNGVYKYGAGGIFPDESFNSSNYWVDVVFVPNTTVTFNLTSVTDANGCTLTGNPISSTTVTIDPNCGPLPIDLLDFRGWQEQQAIQLQWVVATQKNNAYMVVERSHDGKQFKEIGRRAGAGTTHVTKTYDLLDTNPLPGINYYRLRQVDFDSAVSYHPPIAVAFNDAVRRMNVFPNPTRDRVTVQLSAPDNGGVLRVSDLLGRVVLSLPVAEDVSTTELDLSALPVGTYILTLQGQQRYDRMIVKK